MSSRGTPPGRVPTLTEVVRLTGAPAAGAVTSREGTAFARTEPAPLEERRPAPAPALDEEELVQRVLVDVQRQIDLMLEVKLREVLTPALTRATDALMREARTELASALREIVSRAVNQEITRHRGR